MQKDVLPFLELSVLYRGAGRDAAMEHAPILNQQFSYICIYILCPHRPVAVYNKIKKYSNHLLRSPEYVAPEVTITLRRTVLRYMPVSCR